MKSALRANGLKFDNVCCACGTYHACAKSAWIAQRVPGAVMQRESLSQVNYCSPPCCQLIPNPRTPDNPKLHLDGGVHDHQGQAAGQGVSSRVCQLEAGLVHRPILGLFRDYSALVVEPVERCR